MECVSCDRLTHERCDTSLWKPRTIQPAGRGEDDGDHDTFGSREGFNEDLGANAWRLSARTGVELFLTSSGDGIGIGELDTKSSVEGAAMESFIGDSEQIVTR